LCRFARRLALDLTGLPPDPAAVDSFLADTVADAYEKYVDTLLASPHYGERMAIEWLDAARYADSSGYQTDPSRRNWPWRDWPTALPGGCWPSGARRLPSGSPMVSAWRSAAGPCRRGLGKPGSISESPAQGEADHLPLRVGRAVADGSLRSQAGDGQAAGRGHLNATIVHLMGIDHLRLTFPYYGRDFRLTDVHGEVVKGILS
jgi:hypothetical protein